MTATSQSPFRAPYLFCPQTLAVSHPDGTSRTFTVPTKFALLGDNGHERPVAATDCPQGAGELARTMTNAYYRLELPDGPIPDGECCKAGEDHHEAYERKMSTLAMKALQGAEAAFRHELEQHWASFTPNTAPPDGFPYLETVAELAAQAYQTNRTEQERIGS